MVLSLTCSLLAHLTAFACSYNCNILPKEKNNPPFMVELIDLPIKTEMEQMVNQEDSGRKDVVKAPTSLSAKSNLPLTSPGKMKDSNTSTFEAEATVSLDSQELKYVSYLNKIKKKIEPKWHYPETAQEIGLQGKLALCFSIIRDGHLDRLELLNSSGHPLLDEGALKAVEGAAPYYPLPDRLKISRLNILATFEYRISPYSMSTFSHLHQEESL
jgi:TonB family protein